jgi:hypothetical protein
MTVMRGWFPLVLLLALLPPLYLSPRWLLVFLHRGTAAYSRTHLFACVVGVSRRSLACKQQVRLHGLSGPAARRGLTQAQTIVAKLARAYELNPALRSSARDSHLEECVLVALIFFLFPMR